MNRARVQEVRQRLGKTLASFDGSVQEALELGQRAGLALKRPNHSPRRLYVLAYMASRAYAKVWEDAFALEWTRRDLAAARAGRRRPNVHFWPHPADILNARLKRQYAREERRAACQDGNRSRTRRRQGRSGGAA